jgi:hypothetical protein
MSAVTEERKNPLQASKAFASIQGETTTGLEELCTGKRKDPV